MPTDPTSFENFHDIVVPAPPPAWPPAPGVWLLLALCAMLLITAFWAIKRHRQRNAYRRAGLQLLPHAQSLQELNQLLKRVALSAFPRNTIAPLYGKDWSHFLSAQCGNQDFSCFEKSSQERATDAQRERARTWIRQHKTPPT